MGIMLVYDITSAKTFDNISKWIRNIDEVTGTVVVVVISLENSKLHTYVFQQKSFSEKLFVLYLTFLILVCRPLFSCMDDADLSLK